MIYKFDGAEPTIQNGGSARLTLQLPDLQELANALVPNLGNNAKTRHCTNIELKVLRSEATSPAGKRRHLPPSPLPEGGDLGEG